MTDAHFETAKRREFGGFLRSRRSRLTPSDVGISGGCRRRTPGLRREEVALLAGVGATWYTWLEQGRDVKPSNEVLGALCEVLRLDHAERQYIFKLAGRQMMKPKPPGEVEVGQPLLRMLSSLTDQPAYVLDRKWNVLRWNRSAKIVFGDYSRLAREERNSMYMLFKNPDHRELLLEWSVLAPIAVKMFRAENAAHAEDPDYNCLVESLASVSPDFRRLWLQHEVSNYVSINKRIRHPIAGLMTFEYNSFTADDQSDLKLVVYTPLKEHSTHSKVRDLLGQQREESSFENVGPE